MAISLILLPAIFAFLCVSLTVSEALISPIDYQTPSSCADQWNQKSFACEVEEAKLKIARLESILEQRIGELNAKTQYFRDCEKKIEELTTEIDRLKTASSSFGHDYSRAIQKLSALEEEVRLLWAASRKKNFEIYALEYKALDAERRLKEVTSQVGEMAEIVSEQWIQIQQLEQAVHMAEMRTSKVRKDLWRRCPFVKFFVTLFGDCLKTLKGNLDPYVPSEGSMLVFCKSQALQTFAAAKHYHHQELSLLSWWLIVRKLIRTYLLANAEELAGLSWRLPIRKMTRTILIANAATRVSAPECSTLRHDPYICLTGEDCNDICC